MTYELAKQLKDAGFPQPPTQDEMQARGGWAIVPPDEQGRGIDKFYYTPTLSELIEACGGKFVLSNLEGRWIAGRNIAGWDDGTAWVVQGDDGEESGEGESPEEAVARLWLVLNKK